MSYLLVFLGAGIGGGLRQAVSLGAVALGIALPWAILAINVAGSFLMAVIAETFTLRSHLPQDVRLFLTTGILGGFTTFSSYSLDAVIYWRAGQPLLAAAYALGSVALSILGLVAGLALMRRLLPPAPPPGL